MNYYNNVDFDRNQALNIVLHKATAPPLSPVGGQLYFNTTDEAIYYYNATISQWVGLGVGNITSVIGGNGLTATAVGSSVTLDINPDNIGIEISGDIVRLKDLGVKTAKIDNGAVTTGKLADAAVTTIKVTDQAITFAKLQNISTMTVIGRVVGGTGTPHEVSILNENDMISNSATALATQASIKAYVDATVAGIGSLIGSFNAATNTNFPSTGTTKKGDYWIVSAGGTVQGVTLNIGDMIIALQNAPSATNYLHWAYIESNRDQATTTVLGVISLATSAEVIAGTNATKAITPSTLATLTATDTRRGLIEIATQAEVNAGTSYALAVTPQTLLNFYNTMISGWFETNIGNGTLTTFTFTHNLNTRYLAYNLIDNTTNASGFTDVSFPTINTVTITFSRPPATNQFTLILKK